MELLAILADLASEPAEPDQGLFFALGGLLAGFALLAGLYGITRQRMEGRAAAALAVLGAVLVVAAMASSVITA